MLQRRQKLRQTWTHETYTDTPSLPAHLGQKLTQSWTQETYTDTPSLPAHPGQKLTQSWTQEAYTSNRYNLTQNSVRTPPF